jgi:hypothetical protein
VIGRKNIFFICPAGSGRSSDVSCAEELVRPEVHGGSGKASEVALRPNRAPVARHPANPQRAFSDRVYGRDKVTNWRESGGARAPHGL